MIMQFMSNFRPDFDVVHRERFNSLIKIVTDVLQGQNFSKNVIPRQNMPKLQKPTDKASFHEL